jgi:hypothetical protein
VAKVTETDRLEKKSELTKVIRSAIRDFGIAESEVRKVCEAAINNSRG